MGFVVVERDLDDLADGFDRLRIFDAHLSCRMERISEYAFSSTARYNPSLPLK